jgi:hypothetical protein
VHFFHLFTAEAKIIISPLFVDQIALQTHTCDVMLLCNRKEENIEKTRWFFGASLSALAFVCVRTNKQTREKKTHKCGPKFFVSPHASAALERKLLIN